MRVSLLSDRNDYVVINYSLTNRLYNWYKSDAVVKLTVRLLVSGDRLRYKIKARTERTLRSSIHLRFLRQLRTGASETAALPIARGKERAGTSPILRCCRLWCVWKLQLHPLHVPWNWRIISIIRQIYLFVVQKRNNTISTMKKANFKTEIKLIMFVIK